MYEERPNDAGQAHGTPPDFRWGAAATVMWTIALGVFTFGLMMVAAFAVAILGLAVRDGLPQTGTGQDIDRVVELVLRETANHTGALTVLQTLVVIAGVCVLTRPRGTLTRARMLGLGPVGIGSLVLWAAGAVAVLAGVSMAGEHVLGINENEALDWLGALRPVWLVFFLLVVLAPLSEELLFRGFLFGGLQGSVLGPFGAVVASSAVWAVIHMQYDWTVVGLIFIYGLVFGIVRWKSRSLWPPILAHGAVNLIAGLSAYHKGLL